MQLVLVALLLVLVPLLLLTVLVEGPAARTLPMFGPVLGLIAGTCGAWALLRQARLGWAVGVICATILLVQAQILVTIGLAHHPQSLLALLLPLTLAGLAGGRRALVLVAGLSIALVVGVALAQYVPATPLGPAVAHHQYTGDTGSMVFTFVLVVGILGLFLDRFGLALRTALVAAERRAHDLQREIAERVQAEQTLRHQALHDALTDLPNRTLLYDRLEQALLLLQRQHQPLALLLLDLDRFKEVNDTFGHAEGDLLLQQVAARLRGAVRAADTVARLGGDEFAVLLPGADAVGAQHVAQGIRTALESPILVEGQPVDVGASLGIALAPDHGTAATLLLRHADVAMYTAKRTESGVAVYDAAHDQHCPERVALVADLRQAIAQGDLLLHYQPQVDLATGQVRGVEALARWPHPARGMIPPDQFIPLAEQTGLIASLTARVLEAALQQCEAWQRRGLPLIVAVNLSMGNLLDPRLPDSVADLLRRYQVPAHCLRLELTESSVMADVARSQDVLARLAALGVRLSVDDFGTGYSSLAYLKRLPVDEIKIDRSFVQHVTEDEADATIVSSTIGLGHSLGLTAVAEGVEDERAWALLQRLGCDVVQGYYLSRPLPAHELERWLRARADAEAAA